MNKASPAIAPTVDEYIATLPPDRQAAVSTVRQVILNHLPAGYIECIQSGMLSYVIPLERYPNTYNKQPMMMAAIASQKNYMSLHLVCLYVNQDLNDWFTEEWNQTGKKLDMGKGCVRFKTVEALPLELIANLIARVTVDEYIAAIERAQKLSKR